MQGCTCACVVVMSDVLDMMQCAERERRKRIAVLCMHAGKKENAPASANGADKKAKAAPAKKAAPKKAASSKAALTKAAPAKAAAALDKVRAASACCRSRPV